MNKFDLSKLPVWARPLPPLVLLCVFILIGYGIHRRQSPVAANSPTSQAYPDLRSQSPGTDGQSGIFTAPDANSQKSPGAADSKSNPATLLNQPLRLSKDGAAGVALEKFRNSPLAKSFGKALEDQKQGRTAQAIEGYRDVLHQMPDALPAHLNLAVAYLQSNQPAKAIPHLQVVAKADPNNVNVLFELAKVLASQKRLNEAMPPLQRVVKLMPQNPQPRVMLAQLFYAQKNYSGAFDQWTALDKIDAAHGQAAYTAGVIAAENMKNPQKALPWLRKAHHLAPYNDQTTLLLGQVLATTGNTKEAEPMLVKIAAKDPKNVGLLRILANVQWQNGNREGAISNLQKVISFDPNNQEAKSALAQALSERAGSQAKSGQLATVGAGQQASQFNPGGQVLLIKQAQVLQRRGRLDEARKLYQQVLQTTPNEPTALLSVASIDMNTKDYSSAYTNFWKAIQSAPQFQPAYGAFVDAAVKSNKEKEAYLLLQGWVKKHPGLSPAKKALQELNSAANTSPKLTPLTSNATKNGPKLTPLYPSTESPDINKNRPATITSPPETPAVKPSAPTEDKPATTTDKPQLTPAGDDSVKSRISPVKPAPSKDAPDATKPAN